VESPECFFVSCDHEPLNTYAGVWALYRALKTGQTTDEVRPVLHLPWMVPYLLRRLWRGTGNRGDVRYSSKKLLSTGYQFPVDLKAAVESLIHGTV
jgi:hypothetical protein